MEVVAGDVVRRDKKDQGFILITLLPVFRSQLGTAQVQPGQRHRWTNSRLYLITLINSLDPSPVPKDLEASAPVHTCGSSHPTAGKVVKSLSSRSEGDPCRNHNV